MSVRTDGIIMPAGFGTEARIKKLAVKMTEIGEDWKYDDREFLAALAVAAGCAIRARWPEKEREGAFTATMNIINHCRNQL